MKSKHLFILSIVLALMVGCVTTSINQNPDGEFTTLSYESEIDPNSFYRFNLVCEPSIVTSDEGRTGIVYCLKNPDPMGQPQKAVIIINPDGILLSYGYELNGEIFLYRLDSETEKYVRFIPEKKDKSGGL